MSPCADELECCRIAEQQLRDEMCEAVRSAEAEAHKRAEDAYQEASYAGAACVCVWVCLCVLYGWRLATQHQQPLKCVSTVSCSSTQAAHSPQQVAPARAQDSRVGSGS